MAPFSMNLSPDRKLSGILAPLFALRTADEIYDPALGVYRIAKEQKVFTYLAADTLAEQRIAAVAGMVRTWPQWPRKEV